MRALLGRLADDLYSGVLAAVYPPVPLQRFKAQLFGYLATSPVIARYRGTPIYARVNSITTRPGRRGALLTASFSLTQRRPTGQRFEATGASDGRGPLVSRGVEEFYAFTFSTTQPFDRAKRQFTDFVVSVLHSPSRAMRPKLDGRVAAPPAPKPIGADEMLGMLHQFLKNRPAIVDRPPPPAAAKPTADRARQSPAELPPDVKQRYGIAKAGALTC